MKRRKSVWLIFLFLAVALIGGCQKKEKESVKKEDAVQAMGRYIEEKQEFPMEEEMLCGFIKKPEGDYEVYGQSKDKIIYYTSKDGKVWEEQNAPEWLKIGKKEMIGQVILGEDGCYYALVDEYGEEDGKSTARQHIYRSEDGEKRKEVEIPMLSEVASDQDDFILYRTFSNFHVMENGMLVVASNFGDEVKLLSPEGKELIGLDIQNPASGSQYDDFFAVKGNTIIGPGADGKEILFFDGEKMKEIRSVEFPVNGSTRFCMLSDGTAFALDKNGIHRLEPEGTLWQTVVDGGLNSMSMPTMYPKSLITLEGEEESYLVLYSSNQLIRYVYDASVPALPEKELTLYSLRENATLRQAVALFQQEHRDVKVNYTVAMGEEDEEKKEDYIRAFHTELLDGNGADVILLDELPVTSYQEKGILEDLSNIVDTSTLLPLVSEGSKDQEGLFYLPLRVRMILAYGDQGAVAHSADIKELLSYIKENGNKDYIKAANPYDFWDFLLSLYKDDLLDEKGSLKEEEFKTLLTDMMSFFENSGIKGSEREEFGSDVTNQRYRPNFFSGFASLINGTAKVHTKLITNLTGLYMVEALEEKVEDMAWEIFGNSLIAVGRVGINKQAKDKELAAEFVKFLFEEAVQGADVYDGMPVNMKVLEAQAKKEQNDNITWGSSEMDENGKIANINGSSPSREVMEEAVSKIKEAGRLTSNQDTLYHLIFNEVAPLLNGEKDVAQTVEAVKKKVNTYTAE